MVRADAIAATSTTRRNRDARSLSMFSPKLRALPSGRVCVAMRDPPGLRRLPPPPRAPRIMLHSVGCGQYGSGRIVLAGETNFRFAALSASEISGEVSMSVVVDNALSVERPMTMSSDGLWIPMLGGLWVATNVGLVGLGLYIHLPGACSFLAGLFNGTLLSVVAVMMASERFQAGTTGLLSGLSLSALRSDGSMVSKAMQGIHSFVDNALHAIGIDGSE